MTERRLILGDCVEAMRELDADSIDAVICDPPYGLEFMGKGWDQPWRPSGERSHGKMVSSPDWNGRERPRQGSAYARSFHKRCRSCGRQEFSGNPCVCESPDWEAIASAPTQMRALQSWMEEWAREALRVLKPGGYLLAFGGTRTYHRLTCGIEDAGFEIRDCLAWMFGQGFPKSLDVSKAIDARAGAQRDVVGEYLMPPDSSAPGKRPSQGLGYQGAEERPTPLGHGRSITAPATEDAARWQGWGTALKPAFEPVVVARKPLAGTVAANVLAHGTGALNIDGCRIAFVSAADEAESKEKNRYADFDSGEVVGYHGWDSRAGGGNYDPPGRWPANVLLSHSPDCAPVGTREVASDGHYPSARPGGVEIATVGHAGQDDLEERSTRGETVEVWDCVPDCPVRLLDEQTGDLGASRFFYCAKVSRAERNAGLDAFEEKRVGVGDARPSGSMHERAGDGAPVVGRNVHPTVKPIDLMRWLIRLVVPPGGVLLDPFAGSGSTGCAAELEQVGYVLIERDPDYMKIVEARTAFWREHGEDGLRIVRERGAGERTRQAVEDAGQLSLLG